jgi:hypothetical protein
MKIPLTFTRWPRTWALLITLGIVFAFALFTILVITTKGVVAVVLFMVFLAWVVYREVLEKINR